VALAWALAVLAASVVDPGVAGTLGAETTLHVHAAAYAGLALAVGYALLAADRRSLLVAVAIATLFGAGVELVQWPLAYRTASALDAAVNAVGAVGGALLWRALAPRVGASTATRLSGSTD
jgi:VanZ family protein